MSRQEVARVIHRHGVVQKQRAAFLRIVAIENRGMNIVRDAVVLIDCASLPTTGRLNFLATNLQHHMQLLLSKDRQSSEKGS